MARVAFYAPLKPPDHPVPSGDRRMARLLIEALQLKGHEATVMSHLRSRDGQGDPVRQERLARLGGRLADRLLRRLKRQAPTQRPQIWLTYHLYYKAPDWIGPKVAAALKIPYLVAEASLAAKRAGGPWDQGHRATLAALDQAARIISINPADEACLPDPARVRRLAPFLDTAPYGAAARQRGDHRTALASRHKLDPAQPWLTAVAMMRPGDKLSSYRLLAEALRQVPGDWQLLLAGDGPARNAVSAAFAGFDPMRVRFLGAEAPDQLPALYAASDLLVWPAMGEAYGMALLEAQAAGLPVVAGQSGGVSAIVAQGRTGLLVPLGDAAAFAQAITTLLADPSRRRSMAQAAAAKAARDHALAGAADSLDAILQEVLIAAAVSP